MSPQVQRFDFFRHNDTVGRFTSSAIFGFIVRRKGLLQRVEEYPSKIQDRKVTRCKSENHVPIVALAKQTRIPDDPSQASGD